MSRGRTLRRAANGGLIRVERAGERRLLLSAFELAYACARWPLLTSLLEALRKQPNVRLAVLFGSVARGDEKADSDLDVLVHLRRDTPLERAELVGALEAASGRGVQLVSVAQAEESPALMANLLSDGRVLVDREREWPRLLRRRRRVEELALEEDLRLSKLAWAAPDALEEIQAGKTAGPR